MKLKAFTYQLLLFVVAFFYATNINAAVKIISLVTDSDSSNVTVDRGTTFSVNLEVDNGSEIAGSALTITYDTSNLTLDSVTSDFFGTFTSQNITTPSEDSGGRYITVGTEKFYSPQVTNLTSEGTMIAAARFDNGSGVDATLFTLNFTAAATGVHTISAAQSVITNTDAGYTSDPNDINNLIPYFVGISGTSYVDHTVSTINSFVVTVEIPDQDGDGIDDDWEIANRPDGVDENDPNVLNYFSANGDYDKDGYSDLQEYLNRLESDPLNATYDPTVKNAPGGTGYVRPVVSLPGVNMLLLGE